MPQIIDFKREIRSYILFNPSIRQHELRWGGNCYTFPARDDVRPEKSAKFSDGEWIPGTYVISDTYNGDELVFDAALAIKNLLGLSQRPDGAQDVTSLYGRFGISFVPNGCSKERYQEVRSAAIRQWEEFRVESAMQTKTDYEHQAAIWKAHGLQAPPPNAEVQEALFILESAHKRSSAKLAALQTTTQEESPEDDLELIAQAKAAAMALAEKASEGKTVDKAKLAEDLWADPVVRAKLLKKYRIRKIGYADDTEESVSKEIAVKELAG